MNLKVTRTTGPSKRKVVVHSASKGITGCRRIVLKFTRALVEPTDEPVNCFQCIHIMKGIVNNYGKGNSRK